MASISVGSGSQYADTPGYTTNVTSSTDKVVTFIGVAAQVFRCTAWGLKPNTLHKAFLLTKDVSIDCAPIGSNTSSTSTYTYGSDLITDAEGKLLFDYSFKPANSPFSTKQLASSNQLVAIIPFGKQAFKVASLDGNSYAQCFIESKKPTS